MFVDDEPAFFCDSVFNRGDFGMSFTYFFDMTTTFANGVVVVFLNKFVAKLAFMKIYTFNQFNASELF